MKSICDAGVEGGHDMEVNQYQGKVCFTTGCAEVLQALPENSVHFEIDILRHSQVIFKQQKVEREL